MTFDAIVFDFDGLLLDTESTMLASWQFEWQQHGLDLDLDTFWVYHGGEVTQDRYSQLATRVGPSYDQEASHARRIAHRERLHDELELRPGIRAWLDDAATAGLQLAIATSSPRSWVSRLLGRHIDLERFAALACGDEVAAPKPDPAVYRLALDKLGLAPGRVIAVEDSPHGVTAAQAAGLRCIAIPNPHVSPRGVDHADLVLGSATDVALNELRHHLA